MSIVTVDQEKCTRCEACVDECPVKIITLPDNNQFPTSIHEREELCINCGHCVAVCPHGALALRTMTPDQCPLLKKDWSVEPEITEQLLCSRRSIRTFKDKSVEQELLTKLLNITRFAPTGMNRQSVNWLVISDKKSIRRLTELTIDWMRALKEQVSDTSLQKTIDAYVASQERGVDLICRDAPHILITHAPQNQRNNCTIALTYVELSAHAFGLGTCLGGWLDGAANNWEPMQQYLQLPEGHTSCGAVMIGYPQYSYHRLPLRNEASITWWSQ